jgi:CheY-like chemotaxis protein
MLHRIWNFRFWPGAAVFVAVLFSVLPVKFCRFKIGRLPGFLTWDESRFGSLGHRHRRGDTVMDARTGVNHAIILPWTGVEQENSADNDNTGRIGDGVSSSIGPEFTGRGRILIVDDTESVRETLAELLEIGGFFSIQAEDATTALAILGRDPAIDALVTDLTMPGRDGITLIRLAREARHDLPAILLTGYAEQTTSISTIAGGNFHVLRKPVESGRLIEELELLLARARRA